MLASSIVTLTVWCQAAMMGHWESKDGCSDQYLGRRLGRLGLGGAARACLHVSVCMYTASLTECRVGRLLPNR